MSTVLEAARRTGKSPETIRRWIRGRKLPERKVGTQHILEEGDLDAVLGVDRLLAIDLGVPILTRDRRLERGAARRLVEIIGPNSL